MQGIIYPNAKPGAINLLGDHCCDFGIGNHLLVTTSKTWSIKKQTDKLDLIKIMKFCTSKDIAKRMKDKPDTGRTYLLTVHLLND